MDSRSQEQAKPPRVFPNEGMNSRLGIPLSLAGCFSRLRSPGFKREVSQTLEAHNIIIPFTKETLIVMKRGTAIVLVVGRSQHSA